MANEETVEDIRAKLSGISVLECPLACDPETGCVITGNICGHPNKSGLQSMHQKQAIVTRRYREARRVLAEEAAVRKAAAENA